MPLRAPAFWLRPPDWRAHLLSPLGALYGAVTARRMARPGARVEIPVICAGNFTLGGAGKTPTVIALAKMLRDMGETPVVVSRGHGGRERGPLGVDPARHAAADVGDEPLEISATAPVVVARDRLAGARAAIAAGASVILLDDGMQNPSLAKDAALAVIDGETWFGNGFCAPAGPLRAPVAAQRPFVDAILVIGGEGAPPEAARLFAGLTRFSARFEPHSDSLARLGRKPVFAFAGIGRPEKFFATLRAAGVEVAAARAFADHHRYGDAELAALAAEASREGWIPVTTVKDFSRIGARAENIFAGALRTLPVALAFDDAEAVKDWLAATLKKARAVRA